MGKNRLEAFSDGVIAILITIMVLELKTPHGSDWADLTPLVAIFLSYVLSFIYLGIYWNNHHHLLHTLHKVNGSVMWANMHLLFWLSLIPFGTAWVGESHFSEIPTALYGLIFLFSAIAYYVLQRSIMSSQGDNSVLKKVLGSDLKGKSSPVLYAIAIPVAFWQPMLSMAIYVLVAFIWLVPDQRIEKLVE